MRHWWEAGDSVQVASSCREPRSLFPSTWVSALTMGLESGQTLPFQHWQLLLMLLLQLRTGDLHGSETIPKVD